MQKRILFFSILLIILIYGFLHAQEAPVSEELYEDVIYETVLPFLEALKEGDVSLIKKYIAGHMYESKKVLLEQNKEYPEFLKKYYQGVEFYVDSVHRTGNYLLVSISIEYPNSDYVSANLYLWQIIDTTQGMHEEKSWKIIDFKYQ